MTARQPKLQAEVSELFSILFLDLPFPSVACCDLSCGRSFSLLVSPTSLLRIIARDGRNGDQVRTVANFVQRQCPADRNETDGQTGDPQRGKLPLVYRGLQSLLRFCPDSFAIYAMSFRLDVYAQRLLCTSKGRPRMFGRPRR
jgi:hypothetical protein